MTLPGNIDTITVTASYNQFGPGAAGDVAFEPNVPTLVDGTAPAFLLGSVPAKLDANGLISAVLPYNDNAALSPTGWVWKVTENIIGRPARAPYYINLTHDMGPSIDLADPRIAPMNPAPPVSTIYGVLALMNTWTAANNFANGLAIGGTTIAPPPGGTSQFLAANGTWQLPPSGAVVSVNTKTGAVVLNPADIGAIAASLAAAKGDLLVASGAGAFAKLTAGTNGQLLEANSAATNGLDWVTPAAGGSTIKVRDAFITSGSITFNSDASFTAYSQIGIAIPASVGDKIAVTISGMWAKAGGDFLDEAILVSGSPVLFASSKTATAAIEGVPWWYPDPAFLRAGGVFSFTAAAEHIDTDGSVHVALMHKGSAGGTWFANTNYCTYVHAVNYGPAV